MSFTYRGLQAKLDRHIVTDAEVQRQLDQILEMAAKAKELGLEVTEADLDEAVVLLSAETGELADDALDAVAGGKSQKKNYLTTKRWMEVTLTLTSDFPFWVREETFVFRKNGEGGGGGKIRITADEKGNIGFAVLECGCKITHEDPPLCSGRWRRSLYRRGRKR